MVPIEFSPCPTANLPAFLSEKEAAAYLSISLSTIRRWRHESRVPFFRSGGVIRYSRTSIDQFIEKNTVQGK